MNPFARLTIFSGAESIVLAGQRPHVGQRPSAGWDFLARPLGVRIPEPLKHVRLFPYAPCGLSNVSIARSFLLRESGLLYPTAGRFLLSAFGWRLNRARRKSCRTSPACRSFCFLGALSIRPEAPKEFLGSRFESAPAGCALAGLGFGSAFWACRGSGAFLPLPSSSTFSASFCARFFGSLFAIGWHV